MQHLNLIADEVMLLTDKVHNDDRGTEEMGLSVYPLLLKLGSAYIEMLGGSSKKGGEVPVAVTEAEAWLLRGKVTAGDKSQTDSLLGVKLLCKIYTVLLAYNTPDLGVGEAGGIDDELTADKRAALGRWVRGAK